MKFAHRQLGIGGIATLTALALAIPALAVEKCEDGFPRVGYLGVNLDACNCTYWFSPDAGGLVWRFREEPRIGDVRNDGPASGKLRPGDVIAAIDGSLITTSEGGRRFASMTPGKPVSLTVRREGREVAIVVAPGGTCLSELYGDLEVMEAPQAPAAPFAPQLPKTPRAPRTPPRVRTAVTPGAAAPEVPEPFSGLSSNLLGTNWFESRTRGWVGVGLDFKRCEDAAQSDLWCFGTLPEVYFVDPRSPAARAGLQRGDVLTHIDGVALNTSDGSKRFTRLAPKQNVRFTLRRGNVTRQVAVVAAEREDPRRVEVKSLLDAVQGLRETPRPEIEIRLKELERRIQRLNATPAPPSLRDRRLRYAGSVGESDVEVRGLDNVVVDDSGDEIVIVTRDATIRVKPGVKTAAKPEKKPRGK